MAFAFGEPKKLPEMVPKIFPTEAAREGGADAAREQLSGIAGDAGDGEFVKGWWRQNAEQA